MTIENKKRFYIDSIIIFILMMGFGYLPAIAPITELGMRILGIFVGCIYAWSMGYMIWPSVFAVILLGFLPGNSVGGVFSSTYGNGTLLMVVWCMIFAGSVEKTGLLSIISEFILTKKFARKSPWMLAFAFFLASLLASPFIGNPACSIFLWVIFYDVTKKLGIAPKTPYVAVVMIGITCLTYLGGSIMPFGVFLQIGIGVMQAIESTFVMNYGSYCLDVFLICVVTLPVLTLVSKFLCPKFEYKEIDHIIDKTGAKLNIKQKVVIFDLIFVIILMVSPNFIATGTPLHTFLSNFGVVGTMALGSLILSVIIIDGETIGDIGKAMVESVPWSMYFMVGAALAVSSAITQKGTGVSEALVAIFNPILVGKTPLVFLAILVIVGCVLTNIMNNIVTLTLLIPLSSAFAGAYAIPPELLVTIFSVILYQGIVLPSGSIMGALLHGNNQWLTPKLIYKYAIIAEVVLAICVIVVGVPVGLYFLF